MKKIILLLLFINSLLLAQVESSQFIVPRSYARLIDFDIADYKSNITGKTRVDVFIEVPYSRIQFVKSGNNYIAKYNLTVSFFDEDGKMVTERMWKEKVITNKFNLTSSPASSNLSYKTFNLSPGKYNFVCDLEDLDSRKTYKVKSKTTVLDFSDSLEISDIVLISKVLKTEKGDKIIPNVSQTVSTIDSSIAFFFEIYSDSNRTVKIIYAIRDQNGTQNGSKATELKLKKGKNVIYQNLTGIKFQLGEYDLLVQINDLNGNNLKALGKRFISKIFGFPFNITNLDTAVEQMVYIASQSDISYIEDAKSYNEKLKRFIAFWKKKDPSPNTVENEILNEYYRRVAYANAHFRSYYDGWKTDMGMIYITLGPPNQVERQPVAIDSKPYEVWQYYEINKTFIFVDQTNFGDYRLLNPIFGDWYRYRQ